MKMSPVQVCLDGPNWEAEGGARLDCLCIAKNPKVRSTCKAGLIDSKQEVMVQRQWKSGDRMGGCCMGGICMAMLEGLQGSWSETQLLVESPDSGHVVTNATCRREAMGEVGDEQAHCGSIWLNEFRDDNGCRTG